MTIQAKVNTIFKTSLDDGSSARINVYKAQALNTKKVVPAPNQHLLIELIDPISGYDRGYIYAPHWNYEDSEIVLPVSYYYQTDNPTGTGWRECCATSNAMMANALLNGWFDAEAQREKIGQPEMIYLDRLANYGDTTDHAANTKTLRSFGIDSYWSTSLTLEDYYLSISNGIPMVMGLAYKGPDQGHIVCGIGIKRKKRVAIVHDPYGARLGPTDEWLSNLPEAGKADVYGFETLEELWFPDEGNGRTLGWGRIVTHIKGQPTVFADI